MANTFKYNASAETLALKKGNFWIGTNDVGKGPTSTTGFWHGISPVRGGYTVYINKATNGPAIYAPNSDSELIILTNRMASQTYTTVAECLSWFMTQTDKMVLNRDFNAIITSGMVIGLSGSFISSYPRNDTTWYDMAGNVNGTLENGATYSTDGMGCVSFDGSDDLVSLADGVNTRFSNTTSWSIQLTFKINSFVNTYPGIIVKGSSSGTGILIFYMSNGILVWKHNNSSTLLSTTITTNSLINISITYGGSGNVLGYLNGNYVGTLGTMSGTESSSPLYLGLGDQYGNQNLYEFYKYNKQLTSTEVLSNFRNADPKMFSSCKTCKDIIDNYPQLAGYDGLYWVYPNGASSTPYQVYCDMTTDGGGWMLVTRSHPTTVNYNGENWGWKGGTIGSINDFSQAYQLGWGEIWDTTGSTFTSYIYGNQRTNFDNGWGPFVYKVASINYSTFFGSDTQQSYTTSTLKSNTAVYGTTSFPGMQGAIGFTTTATNNNIYYMRDCCGFSGSYGGTPTSLGTTYCGANFYYSGPWCGGSTNTGGIYDFGTYVSNGLTYGGTNQYMIMVK